MHLIIFIWKVRNRSYYYFETLCTYCSRFVFVFMIIIISNCFDFTPVTSIVEKWPQSLKSVSCWRWSWLQLRSLQDGHMETITAIQWIIKGTTFALAMTLVSCKVYYKWHVGKLVIQCPRKLREVLWTFTNPSEAWGYHDWRGNMISIVSNSFGNLMFAHAC